MSVKIKSNGRSTLPQLNEKFDKVIIKYDYDKDGTVKTTALLIDNDDHGILHIGVSKFSNRTFNFSKSKGRIMALGRAELSYNIYNNIEAVRLSKDSRREELSYSISANEAHTTDDILKNSFGVTNGK